MHQLVGLLFELPDDDPLLQRRLALSRADEGLLEGREAGRQPDLVLVPRSPEPPVEHGEVGRPALQQLRQLDRHLLVAGEAEEERVDGGRVIGVGEGDVLEESRRSMREAALEGLPLLRAGEQAPRACADRAEHACREVLGYLDGQRFQEGHCQLP